jgi:hypothetical protein
MDLLFLPINHIITKINVNEVKDTNPILKTESPKICNKKNYVRKFIEKNKTKISEKNICPICYSTYTYFNKSKHIKTKRHLTMVNVKNNLV